tara:strand:- start:615 stop:1709 length:1095 start_codon:yes stop_codon:yes gene_type:complete
MATQTTEQTVRLAPFQEEFLADIFKSAQAVTEPGSSMPFAPQQLQGLSQSQLDAIDAARSGVGSFQPFLQGGSEAIGQGIGAVGTGLGAIGTGLGAVTQGLGTVDQAVDQAGRATFDFDPTSYQAFMSPFTEDVIAATQADIARQGQMQQNQIGGRAVASGAFGGSRQAVAEQELARNVMDQQARTGAQLRSQGFQQAQQLAQQAATTRAQQALRQAQLTGQLGQTTGQLGATTGQLGVSTGQLGQTLGQLGTQTAALGQLGQQLNVQDVNTLLGIGGLQQQQGQKQLDINRANELAREALPFQRVGFLSDIFRGVPALQQTTSRVSTPPPSRGSQLLGLGIAGLGAVGQAGGFSNFFGAPRIA